jgi:hypothetical protein
MWLNSLTNRKKNAVTKNQTTNYQKKRIVENKESVGGFGFLLIGE